MFQTAELGQKVTKDEFKERELELRTELLSLQQKLRKVSSFPVLIDFAGVRGAGKGTSASLLNKWMDARLIDTFGYYERSEEENERPVFWRYWRDLPSHGRMGIYLSGRYSRPMLEYVYGNINQEQFYQRLKRIIRFEKLLADDGALIQKFWMHISREVQEVRLRKLEKDPLRSWRMSDKDWKHWELYDRFIDATEQVIAQTNTGHAPWQIIEGEDHYYRSLRVGEVMRDALVRHLKTIKIRRKYQKELSQQLDDQEPSNGSTRQLTIMDGLDMSKHLAKGEYKGLLKKAQGRLGALHQQAVQNKKSCVLVFEGPDAAGKGGSIRHITEPLDARFFKVHQFSAPTDEELAHHYLWRFWRCIPRSGRLTIFDRSWYGRVLVERVEGFADNNEWRRAYAEINDFEEQLIENNIVLLKFWIHISAEEQLARFEARQKIPHKQWKLTEEDWRNRDKWDDYAKATHDMIQHTSKKDSPWILVENNNKHYGRIKVLNAVCDALENAIDNQPETVS